ncbi:MAG: preprotein translocase subunit SecG [Nitrospirae bacterium]|nr:preprotein translocase subunit SecG [Nitrospirota bacterium]
MYVLLIVIHLLTAFVMVGAILLQSGKGAEIGATFGGSSQTIFGGRGAATFLTKFTWGCVVVFMVTSLGLAILSKQRSVGTSLKLPTPPPVSTPSEPAASATPAPATGGTAATSPAAASSAPAPAGTPAAPGGHEGMSTAPSPAAPAADAPAPAAPASPSKP